MPIFRKDDKYILFVHVPKAGGSSIEVVFKNSGYQRDYLDGKMGRPHLNYVLRCTPQHMHGAVLRETLRLERFDAIFMVVREPLARLRSEYLWRNRGKSPGKDAASVEAWARDAFKRYEKQPFLFDNHLRPQHEFLVPGAKVYRLEEGLPHILADIDRQWDLGLDTEIPRVREGSAVVGHASRDVEISPSLARRAKRFYRRDYAEFGYRR